MTPSTVNTDVFAILAVAQANWPHDPVAGSEAVWTKWAELLGPFRFDEVRIALDAMARTHPRLPSVAELLAEIRARREAAARFVAQAGSGLSGETAPHPPVDLASDYVIGPYSAAFAAMNGDGWTTERLIECVRAAAPQHPAR